MISNIKCATTALALLTLTQSALAQIAGGQGCFSSSGNLVDQGPNTYQSSLNCWNTCTALKKPVLGLSGSDCWCGDNVPPQSSVAQSSACNLSCNGFNEPCGGENAWTIYLTNPSSNPGSSDDDSSSSSSGSSSSGSSASPKSSSTPKLVTSQAIVTVGGSAKTVFQTITQAPDSAATPSSSTSNKSSGGGSNTGGIVAGVVVGVVALIAIIGGTWFFLKKRKQRTEGHQRVQSTNAFATAGAGPSGFDARLDPSMVQRRDSTGSVFADNQDYSRRILRVANPDDR